VHVRVLAINDFHGNLAPPVGKSAVVVAPPGDPVAPPDAGHTASGNVLVPAGGAAYLAAHIARLRAENPNTVVVSAGDLTGASPLASNLLADEPTVVVMNRIGLDIEGVGNHDFDRGVAALEWLQHGGCSVALPAAQGTEIPRASDPWPARSAGECDAGTFPGASFAYLSANVVEVDAGHTLFPPYVVKDFQGARVAFIGETLAQTPKVTSPAAVSGLSFVDEADAANALVADLKAQGVAAIVLVLHQGGAQGPGGTYDSCVGLSGALMPILDRLSPAIDVVVSAHTHEAYDCILGGRLVTSAGSYGRLVTAIDLAIDPGEKRVVEKHARNVPVTHDIAPDRAVAELAGAYAARVAPVADRVVGYLKADVTNSPVGPSCESPLGDLIADSMQAATGADVAFINRGGIRGDLVVRPGRAPNALTLGDVFEVEPFGNTLVTLALKGADLRAALEKQFSAADVLQVSRGLAYRYAKGSAKSAGRVFDAKVGGKPLDPARTYLVTIPSFLAFGGDDRYSAFKLGKVLRSGPVDLAALVAFLGKESAPGKPLDWHPASRVDGDGCR
jgi:5'-nucleotidase